MGSGCEGAGGWEAVLGLWLRWAAAGGEKKVEELGEGGGDGSEAAVPRLQGRHGRRRDGGEQASASVTKCE